MTSYTITANGTTMGTYEGTDEAEAIDAYYRDAGYGGLSDAAQRLLRSEDELLEELTIEEA